MEIKLNNISKRFNYSWIFKDVTFVFEQSEKYAVLGSNGSGKSTLLKIISGNLNPSEGNIQYFENKQSIDFDDIPTQINFAAPYIDFPELLTTSELLDFHHSFKNYQNGINKEKFFELLNLKNVAQKSINEFSSGMRQRLRLALTFLFDSKLVLLDEPLTNLDEQGKEWYYNLIDKYLNNRTLIIASNQKEEYKMCEKTLNILDFKK